MNGDTALCSVLMPAKMQLSLTLPGIGVMTPHILSETSGKGLHCESPGSTKSKWRSCLQLDLDTPPFVATLM